MCISPVVDSEFWCLSSCIKYIYFYVSDFGERGQFAYLHILCSWLVFVHLIYIVSCKLRAKYYCCLNLYISYISHFVIMCFFHLTGFMVICLQFPYGLTFSFLCIKQSFFFFRHKVLLLWRMWHKIVHPYFPQKLLFFSEHKIWTFELLFLLFISFVQRMFLSLKKKGHK